MPDSVIIIFAGVLLLPAKPVRVITRGCTGFDGGMEAWEAIRRLRGCVTTWNLNIKAEENYALAA